jgi:hypothetical protein
MENTGYWEGKVIISQLEIKNGAWLSLMGLYFKGCSAFWSMEALYYGDKHKAAALLPSLNFEPNTLPRLTPGSNQLSHPDSGETTCTSPHKTGLKSQSKSFTC